MLSVENLSIKYPDKRLPALNNVNFELPKGSVCFLKGDCGSGHTTLCLALAGLLIQARPESTFSGVIKWNDKIIDQNTFYPEIAITLENPYSQFSGIKRTVLEEMAFGLEMRGINAYEMEQRITMAAETFKISHLLKNDPNKLSGGETQKVVIANSYVLLPELWILDRPLTELDPLARFSFLQNIKRLAEENSTTIIISEEPADDIFDISTHLLTVNANELELSSNDHKSSTKRYHGSAFPSAITFSKSFFSSSDNNSLTLSTVQIKNLDFRYAPDKPMIFNSLNIEVDSGQCLWITGPNGCGKTTFAKIVAGILKASKDSVRIDSINPYVEPVWNIAKHAAYSFQNPDLQIFSTTLLNEVSFGPKALGYSKDECHKLTSDALNLFGLGGKEQTHPHDLSRAERKRLGLASTFAMNTPIIILDEPTQFQNAENKQLIKEAIKEGLKKEKSILCITHDLWLLQQF